MTSSLKLVFAGTPEFALPCLEALAQSPHDLSAVYTQPDRPAGRGRKLQHTAVKRWALLNGVPVCQPLNFKTEDAVAGLAALQPDVFIVIAYGLILPPEVLSLPPLGCINVHASLLPRWRGASPIQQALLHGDTQSGVTIMQMDAGMDTGDKLAQASCPVYPFDTAGSLHDRLALLGIEPLLATLDALACGQAQPEAQNNSLATCAKKIKKEDAAIDWQKTAQEIHRQIRAFNPWPIAFTQAGNDTLRIHKAHPVENACSAAPGTVVSLDGKGMLVVAGEQALMIEVLQFPGGRAMTVADWLNAGRSQLHVDLVLG